MIRKTLGYVLAGLGVIGLVGWSFPETRAAVPNFEQLVTTIGGEMILAAVSVVLIVVGLFIAVKGGGRGLGGRKSREVPIYQGKNVVGYRRD